MIFPDGAVMVVSGDGKDEEWYWPQWCDEASLAAYALRGRALVVNSEPQVRRADYTKVPPAGPGVHDYYTDPEGLRMCGTHRVPAKREKQSGC